MITRGKWQGMMIIARLNWPFYAGAGVILVASLWGVFRAPLFEMRFACGLALAGSAYFLLASLGASHLVYDRSDLYQWEWLNRALSDINPASLIFCHAGFDETSEDLREKFKDTHWLVLDHFDARKMTEASIRRARRLFPPTPGTLPAAFADWPVKSESIDVIFALLAIHELRTEAERTAWFAEAKRCLKPGGRVVLAEHQRDLANFLAFGPGFLHFHSPRSWRRCWERAGLSLLDGFQVTPWIRVFILVTP